MFYSMRYNGMYSMPFSDVEFEVIKSVFPDAVRSHKNSIILGKLGDTRKNTVDYRIFKYEDGYRVRRKVLNSFRSYQHRWDLNGFNYEAVMIEVPISYQMFRNSHKDIWPAMSSAMEVAVMFERYSAKMHLDLHPIISQPYLSEKYICPECGHEFVQGEYDYNYDTALLDFECPECGWSGTDYNVEREEE